MFYASAHVQECKDRKNRWRGVLKYKDPETGAWKERKKTFKGVESKSEALTELGRWRLEMESEAYDGGTALPSEKPLGVAIVEYLNEQFSLGCISVATFQNMKRVNEVVIAPRIGSMMFNEVTRFHLQDFVDSLARQYAPTSVKTYFAVVSKIYKEAVRRELIESDPTERVILPRVPRRRINYLDEKGRAIFLAKMNEDSCYFLPSMIAFYTGMRAGEICGLQWRDVKLRNNVINVRRTAVFREGPNGGDVMLCIPKTPTSNRDIPILKQLRPILDFEFEAGTHEKDSFVVAQNNPKLLCSGFLKWAARNGVYGTTSAPISLHGLRHTFATLGVQSGMDVKSLSSLLGHASAAMTLDIYASDDKVAKKVAMETLSEFLWMEASPLCR